MEVEKFNVCVRFHSFDDLETVRANFATDDETRDLKVEGVPGVRDTYKTFIEQPAASCQDAIKLAIGWLCLQMDDKGIRLLSVAVDPPAAENNAIECGPIKPASPKSDSPVRSDGDAGGHEPAEDTEDVDPGPGSLP